MKPKIGLINSGGDCPGLNTVIDAVTKCLYEDYDLLGFYRGFEGLLAQEFTTLTPKLTSQYKFQGGTFLKSVNKGNFAIKTGYGELNPLNPDVIKNTVQNYKKMGLEALIVMGGDGTMNVARLFEKEGLNIVAVPKSIDNDLLGTHFTFGFQTAVDIATEALDKLETTGFSHDRIMILEVMGRNTGWISLYSGISGGANVVLIPEIPFHYNRVYNFLQNRSAKYKKNALIVVAEGAKPASGQVVLKDIGSKASEAKLGGIGDTLAKYLNQFPDIEARSTSLGHIQRGGGPNSVDRLLSRLYGVKAATLIEEKKFGVMVAYQNGEICEVPIENCVDKVKVVDSKSNLILSAKKMGIFFGE